MTDLYADAALAGRPLTDHFVMDAHAHLGQNNAFLILDTSLEGFIRERDRLGIDLTAVSSIPGTLGGWARGNDLVIEAVQTYPGRFLGYITVNSHHEDRLLKECDRCWEAGCRALKLHSSQGVNYDDARLRPALEFANEKGCPVLFHTWGGELEALEKIIGRYPRAIWILAHSGCTQREDYVRLATDYPQLYLETCFSICPKGLIEYFVREGLADKLLWGSDAYFMNGAHQFGRVLLAEISPADKQKILCDNPRRVFDLPSP